MPKHCAVVFRSSMSPIVREVLCHRGSLRPRHLICAVLKSHRHRSELVLMCGRAWKTSSYVLCHQTQRVLKADPSCDSITLMCTVYSKSNCVARICFLPGDSVSVVSSKLLVTSVMASLRQFCHPRFLKGLYLTSNNDMYSFLLHKPSQEIFNNLII